MPIRRSSASHKPGTLPPNQEVALALKAKFLRGLADPSRLSILDVLRSGEQSVSEVVAATGLSQPNVSGHLACLKDCGLVTSRQAGRFVYYALADPGVEAVLQGIETILARVAERIYVCTRFEE